MIDHFTGVLLIETIQVAPSAEVAATHMPALILEIFYVAGLDMIQQY